MAKINAINNKTQDLTIDPGASGDSYVQFDINGTGEFRIGVDDDAADAFKISQGSALGSNDTFVMTAAGERTLPLQPAFLAYLGTTDSNVTGDGTVFTLGSGNALTEVFDQNGDFNTNGTFTAPVTGRYLLNAMVLLDDLAAGHELAGLLFLSSNRDYYSGYQDAGAMQANGDLSYQYSVLADMDVSDTVTFRVDVAGGAKVVDIVSSNADTCFSGVLIC